MPVTPYFAALFIVGCIVFGVGLVSRALRTGPLSSPLLALVIGVALGPLLLNLARPAQLGDDLDLLREAARLTLGFSVLTMGLRLPVHELRRIGHALATVLGLVMPATWALTATMVGLALGLDLPTALLIGAVMTPTDPVLASTVLSGGLAERSVPARVRQLLSAESGTNDGLALPFVAVARALGALVPAGEPFVPWLIGRLLWQIGGAVIGGLAVGWVAGRVLVWVRHRELIVHESFVASALALAAAILGAAELIKVDTLLAVFAAALALRFVLREEASARQLETVETVNRFLELPVFALFGMMLPWSDWVALGWTALVIVVAVLLLRRLPAILLAGPLLKPVNERRDLLFIGWFGPIGIGTLYWSLYAVAAGADHIVFSVASLVVCASIVVHGASGPSFTRWYQRAQERAKGESVGI
jgi:NhaP-type Na+/H+ or K+/H+ antiporter